MERVDKKRYKPEFIKDKHTPSPFEEINGQWFLKSPIQTKDYVEGKTGFKLDPDRKGSKVFQFGEAGKNRIFAQNVAPARPNDYYQEGDLWFDTDDDNHIYRANSNLQWVSLRDGSIVVGAIKTFRQASIPTAENAGDIWTDTNNDKTYRATNAGDNEIKAGEWEEIATKGATFGENISGGGSNNMQVGNDGYVELYRQTIFGDGEDGDVTISANTTLTSDMYYNNLTIDAGVTLNTGGYRIFVKGTLTNNGTIERNGNPGGTGGNATGSAGGAGGTGASALSNGTLYGGLGGANGGTGGSGSNAFPGDTGVNQSNSLASNGSSGGNGSSGLNGGNPGVGGSGGIATQTTQRINNYSFAVLFKKIDDNTLSFITTSASGGGGGGGTDANDYGGGGGGAGGSGGVVMIVAKNITNTGTISANGGVGGNGGNGEGQAGGGGGGAGGSGGVLVIIYEMLTNNGTIEAAGGAGGVIGAGGKNDGSPGNTGLAGKVIYLNV